MSQFAGQEMPTPPPPSVLDINVSNGADGAPDSKSRAVWGSYDENNKLNVNVATYLHDLDTSNVNIDSEAPKTEKLDTFRGIYIPNIQSVFGVMVFVRFTWMVGVLGIINTMIAFVTCCIATLLTVLSLCALATNGIVKTGGSYFMISRNLGSESGGAVGLCFYLVSSLGIDFLVLGCLEIFLKYIAPDYFIVFGSVRDLSNMYRFYGPILLVIILIVSLTGIKVVQTISPILFAGVLVSMFAIFLGAFIATPESKNVWICMLGDVLLIPPKDLGAWPMLHNQTQESLNKKEGIASWCNDAVNETVWCRYCTLLNDTEKCTPYFSHHRPPTIVAGIPGIRSGILKHNLHGTFMKAGESTPGYTGSYDRGEVTQDITTTFLSLMALFFYAVVDPTAGANNSGYLKDPQTAIPHGTLAAWATVTVTYTIFLLVIGGSINGNLLRDKYGDSIGGELLSSILSWPSKWLILVGSLCACLGGATQGMSCSPRLLQAIAKDGVVPFLLPFEQLTKSGEPRKALILTFALTQVGVLVGRLDLISPVLSIFYQVCYAMVNMACAVLSILQTPNWRPRFRYYHWSLSSAGVLLNVFLAFMSGWYYALCAFLIVAAVYKYIQYKGCEKEWGDGIKGYHISAAQNALLRLEDAPPHTKNWRPQVVVLCKIKEHFQLSSPQILSLAHHLKEGKGLTIVATILKGDLRKSVDRVEAAGNVLKAALKESDVKGFSKVIVAENMVQALSVMMQSFGFGALCPNTVVIGWPSKWQFISNPELVDDISGWPDTVHIFLQCVRVVMAKRLALLVVRGLEEYPTITTKLSGTLDVWWILRDGGMLVVLAFLLGKNKSWRNCKMRIFTVAQGQDNTVNLKNRLEKFLYDLRITADVYVVEGDNIDISAYTAERTMTIQERRLLMKYLQLQRGSTIQEILDETHFSKDETSIISGKDSNVHDPRTEDSGQQFPPRNISQQVSNEEGLQALDQPNQATQTTSNEGSSHVAQTTSNEGGVQVMNRPKEVNQTTSNEGGFRVAQTTSNEGGIQVMNQQKQAASASSNEETSNQPKLPTKPAPNETQPPGNICFKLGDRAGSPKLDATPQEASDDIMRMQAAHKINEKIVEYSGNAALVIINFPTPPSDEASDKNFMTYLTALSANLHRVLLVHGSGNEVVTIYT